MTTVAIERWSDPAAPVPKGLAGLLAAYHLATEAEKGAAVADVALLPDRYRAEVADARNAFAGDVVLVARLGHDAVGCVVVTTPGTGTAEIKRLWVTPAARGRGVADTLLHAALANVECAGLVRLSVWRWRTRAIALYERLGFAVVEPWDDRADLVCMARAG